MQIQLGQKQIAAELTLENNLRSGSAILPGSILVENNSVTKPRLPNSVQLNSRLLSGPILKIGPVVGVLLGRKPNSEYRLPVGKVAKTYKEMSLAASKRMILMYFFHADGVDWHRKLVNGHMYVQLSPDKAGWVKGLFPLPDIIYNRIVYRFMERQSYVQKFLKRAAEESIYLFNSRFLDKWEVHKSLCADPIARFMVPETELFSKQSLNDFVEKFREFFIKPIGNSVGKGIVKVRVAPSSQTISYYAVGSKKEWQQCHSTIELYKQLGINRGEKYILQKGIDLATISGKVFDVRAQVQKNGSGEWQITGKGIRIAAPGKFVTHVPNGGTKANYESTIREVFGNGSELERSLNQQLTTISQKVPSLLEERLNLKLAILSLDIGIDKEGRMWIIEVNSKPASFDEDAIRQQHWNLLNDYLLYKTDFSV